MKAKRTGFLKARVTPSTLHQEIAMKRPIPRGKAKSLGWMKRE